MKTVVFVMIGAAAASLHLRQRATHKALVVRHMV